MEALFSNVLNLQWQQVVMWGIGALLIYLAIAKDMEPTLLLPHGVWRHSGQPAACRARSTQVYQRRS